MSTSWADIQRQLDPDMPEEDYNKIRQKYFADKILPTIDKEKYSPQATYEKFLQQTERPNLNKYAAQLGGTLGELAFQGAALSAITAVTGPVSGALADTLFGGGRLAAAAAKIGTGGLAFATYDALQAKDGDRVAAGIKGGLSGALFEAGLGALFGFGEREAAQVAHEAISGVPAVTEKGAVSPGQRFTMREGPADVVARQRRAAKQITGGRAEPSDLPVVQEQDLEQWRKQPDFQFIRSPQGPGTGFTHRPVPEPPVQIPETVAEAPAIDVEYKVRRQLPAFEGSPLPPFGAPAAPDVPKAVAEGLQQDVIQARKLKYTKGPMVETPAKKGMRAVISNAAGQSTTINIARGNESVAVGHIQEIVDQGGALDSVEFHPGSRARATEFMANFADEAENQAPAIRLKTTDGDPISVVVPEQAVEPAAPVKPPEVTDTISKPMLQIGEIRNRIILSGNKRGPTVPRAEHATMHHLAGQVGKELNLTRSQVGQLSSRYFNYASAAGESAESALKFVEPYRGAGEKFGVVPGEAPPKGFEEASRFPGMLKPTPGEAVRLDLSTGELRNRATGRTLVLPQTSEELGATGAQTRTPEGPLRVLAKDMTRGDIYHESIHDGLDHTGLAERVPELSGPHSGTAKDIAKGLKRAFPAYGDHNPAQLMNEAFTHAAEAIRMGDTGALEELARYDKSVAHVKAFVGDTARNLLEESKTADSAPVRAFQRRLNDLIRRTDPEIADALDRAQVHGWNTWFDPEVGKWVQRDGEGREFHASSPEEVWDRIHDSDASAHFPDVAAPVYYKGVKGSFVPEGSQPVPGASTPEVEAIPHLPIGLQSIASVFRPAMDWASSVQKVLDRLGVKADFYGPVRRLELAAREASGRMVEDAMGRDSILKGLEGKRKELGEILSLPRDTWGAHMEQYGLTGGHLARLEQLAEWDSARVAKGQTSLLDTLSSLRAVREVDGDLGRVGADKAVMDAIKNSNLGYTDLDVGKISKWVMRNDYEIAVAADQQDVYDLMKQFKNNRDLTVPLRNYVNHIMGVPDSTQDMMNTFAEGFQKHLMDRATQLNKSLPKGMQIPDLNLGKDFWPTFRTIMYTSGLGLRPAVAIRDMYQSMFGLVTIGPRAFAEGLARAMTKEGRAEAAAAGALLHGRNVGQAFGDITSDIPTGAKIHDYVNRMADTLMAPSRMGHNFGRIITYLGEQAQAERAITAFRAGPMDEASIKELVNRTSAWFHDSPEQSRLIALASDPTVSASEAAKAFGLSANEATQFGGSPGMALRSGMGRILGQYASWPMNHLEFSRKLGMRVLDNPLRGGPAFGMWAGINYAAFKAAESVGIDATKWLGMSPAGWTGSPALDFTTNLLKSPEESDAGRKARHDILMSPIEILPTGVELRNLYEAYDSGDFNLPKILGFRTLKDNQKERDLEDQLFYEFGFKPPQ